MQDAEAAYYAQLEVVRVAAKHLNQMACGKHGAVHSARRRAITGCTGDFEPTMQ